ncbi:hypothetical protein L0U85_09310 [Glycomyces sp. L485]|uniref:hypothetical protein n=1 Tax=Glycomyces sp. L485 TaxID=2909235 RepID=UPI001F4A64C9|nr:hypothetical protein [Glycomyces sp. L485]MCH7231047.1 hypothetical protein [Glycomyces sp. L485]
MSVPDPVTDALAKRVAGAAWRALKRSLAWLLRRSRRDKPAPEKGSAPGPVIRQDIRANDQSRVIAPIIGDVNVGAEPEDKEPEQ